MRCQLHGLELKRASWQLGWLLVHLLTGRDITERQNKHDVERVDETTGADGHHPANLAAMLACGLTWASNC